MFPPYLQTIAGEPLEFCLLTFSNLHDLFYDSARKLPQNSMTSNKFSNVHIFIIARYVHILVILFSIKYVHINLLYTAIFDLSVVQTGRIGLQHHSMTLF